MSTRFSLLRGSFHRAVHRLGWHEISPAAMLLAMVVVAGWSSAGCAPAETQPGPDGGTSTATGGNVAGSGGVPAIGGSTGMGTGGDGAIGSGGAPATGGVPATGGAGTATGGQIGGGTGGATGGGTGMGTGGASGGSGGAAGGAGGGISQTGGMGGVGGTGAIVQVPPCAANELATRCTGTNPVQCHFGGVPGNYEVTVELGAATAGDTYVDAESFRRMLAQTATAAGQTRRFSFITNVRANESEPDRPGDSATDVYTSGMAGLDIYFRGPTPKVTAICQKVASPRPVMLWILGDSTVTDQQFEAYAGWGQHLPQHLLPPVSVANYADSGESSGSGLAKSTLFNAVKPNLRPGDWVFVQFGHNDDGSTSDATFRANMLRYVSDSKAAGALPVLVTPISRAQFTGNTVNPQHGNFPAIMRQIGQDMNVPVIDLTARTISWLTMLGPSGWRTYFANGTDATHTNHAGADIISGFVRDAIRTEVPALAKYLR